MTIENIKRLCPKKIFDRGMEYWRNGSVHLVKLSEDKIVPIVELLVLIATGTIEEKILRFHDTKRQLADSLCVSYVWLSNLYQSKLLDFYRGLELAF